jgi:hypothetical protein
MSISNANTSFTARSPNITFRHETDMLECVRLAAKITGQKYVTLKVVIRLSIALYEKAV